VVRLIRGFWLFAMVLLAVPLLSRFGALLSTPVARLGDIVDFIYDDGYYYLGIAANLADTGRSTLDGLTGTNGYQPAWLLVLTLLAKLVGTDTHTFYVASCTLVYAIACATPLLALLWRHDSSRTVALCVGAALAIVIVQQPLIFLVGLEPILFPPLVLAMIVLLERRETDPRRDRKLSALLACAFLVRIDALVLYAATCICMPLFESPTSEGILVRASRRAVRLSIFVVPTVLAYAVLNEWLFGSPVPVSGLSKAVGGPLFSNWGIMLTYVAHLKTIVLLAAVLLALELSVRRFARAPEPIFYRSLTIVAVAMVLHCLYYAALSTWILWPWYQYLVAIAVMLIIARIIYLASLFELRRAAGMIAVAALGVIAALAISWMISLTRDSLPAASQARLTFLRYVGIRPSLAADTLSQEQANLAMLAEFFPPGRDTVIAMGDRSGGLAYWGRDRSVRIEQTEGLTLGMDYYRARVANAGARYLERFPIEYLVVDREVIPTTRGGNGQLEFVVADPIQGRVSKSPVPTFCFPADAIRYKKVYRSWRGTSERLAFSFAQRIPCSSATLARLRLIELGIGLRQFSLPSEYDPPEGAPSSKQSEDRDRHYRRELADNVGFGRYVGGEVLAE
jgi:hypothetical protein